MDIKQFVTAGNAIFTVQSHRTGRHFTYQVQKSEPTEKFPNPAYFVRLLTGPDNNSDYTYLGMLNPETGAVNLSRKSNFTDGTPSVVALRWVCGRLWTNQDLPGCEIRHEGRCGKCGKKLTTIESIDRGFGAKCLAIMDLV